MTRALRERDHAHMLLAEETERALGGAGGLVLFQGATGTGRTSVLEAAAEHAERRGLRVRRARCSPEDVDVPLSAVGRLLGHVPEYAGMPSADYHRRADRLWELLRSLAAESPILLAVDDVHLADPSSRRWLAEVAGRLDGLPVLLVATERRQYDIDPQPAGLARALSTSFVRTHTLAPLTDAASAEMLGALLPAADPQWTAACVRAGAGHPMLLSALLDDLCGTPPLPLPDTCAALYPGAYPAAVSWWLDSAGKATAEVARTLAALEEVGTSDMPDAAVDPLDLLAEASGADPARVAGWLTAMTRLGLLRLDASGRRRYAHPLLRDAVLSGWPTPRRQAVHRAAAEALLARGGRGEAVARHLLRAPAVGEPWALRVLRDAVTVALDAARTGDAVGYLRRALGEPLTDAVRQRLLTELGSLEYHSGDPGAAISRLAEALHLEGEPRNRVHTALALGTALAGQGEVRTAMGMLRRTEAGLSGDPGLARSVQTASTMLSDHDQFLRQEAYRWLGEAAGRSPDLVGTAGQALLVRHAAAAGRISAQDAMKQLHALLAEPADPFGEPFLVGTAAAVAQWADELDEAEQLVERGLALQRCSLLHPIHRALVNTRDDIAAARGDYAGLLDGGAEPVRAGAGPADKDAHVLMALVHADRTDEARRFAARFELSWAPDTWELNRFLYARGVSRAAMGDSAGALHDLLECGRRQLAREVVSPVITPWRTAVAECRSAPGRTREALDMAEEELRLARVWNTPRTVGRALRVLGTVTGGRRGLELADEAVRILRTASVDVDMELIPALLAQGRQLIGAGERSRARDSLREAAERAERKGAVRLYALAGQALREGGARHRTLARTGSAALTGSERRIAELAAEGRTNAEIAELLHLARRTVETHLTHAYRKLRIRRRSELTDVLGA
ncbi:LuxR C-terminal-related transcriptional regulator [Streptomyces sp. NPDC002793]|uniref:LuxR C-terminal-related transcriptional regulator n=1 Tax=Streptomyces sp. NPDC002793 TaxID=3154432 RepID=UPI003318955D